MPWHEGELKCGVQLRDESDSHSEPRDGGGRFCNRTFLSCTPTISHTLLHRPNLRRFSILVPSMLQLEEKQEFSRDAANSG